MKNKFYTYIHCKPNGDPFYVGKGTNGKSHATRSHALHKDRNRFHQNIVAKYGAKNILIYVFGCESESQAYSDEIQQIANIRALGFKLCNMTDGGDGVRGKIVTQETRLKISKAHLGKTLSAKARKKISDWHKGKIVSEETRKKLSKSLTEYWKNKSLLR